ncbi:hypothetical protein [Chitinophaga eiseniae]|uniref:hypothetical protein n=1 Tax=Chitinophaga eiseniae TaxID=634771 RepID=UPI001455C82C|nr:hypothetical protein [Chitinophaga eiseniae]
MEQVRYYFLKLDLDIQHADAFYWYHSISKWKLGSGKEMRNWKVAAVNWIVSFRKAIPLKEMRRI